MVLFDSGILGLSFNFRLLAQELRQWQEAIGEDLSGFLTHPGGKSSTCKIDSAKKTILLFTDVTWLDYMMCQLTSTIDTCALSESLG